MGGARGELSLDTLSLRCLLDTRPRHLGDDGPREPAVQEMGLGWRDRSSLKLSEKQRGPWAEPWSPPRARGQGGGDTRVRPAEGDQEWVVARLPGRSVLGGRTWSAPSMTVQGQAGPRSRADGDKEGPGDH